MTMDMKFDEAYSNCSNGVEKKRKWCWVGSRSVVVKLLLQ